MVNDPCDPKYALELSDSLMYSNLGGLGPDFDAPRAIYYSNVIPYADEPVDLEVSVTSGNYKAGDASVNGVFRSFGIINVHHDSFANLKFRLVEKKTGNSYINPSSFYFTVFDLDTGFHQTSIESIYISNRFEPRLSHDVPTELVVESSGDFWHVVSQKYGFDQDNPTSPMTLTSIQKARSVSVLFPAGSSEFDMTLQVTGGRLARNFMFSGRSSLDCPARALCSTFRCPSGELKMDANYILCAGSTCSADDASTCCCSANSFGHFDAADVIESSLGERSDGKIKFVNVEPGVDMTISALSNFERINPSASGIRGSFAALNVVGDSLVQFKFSFKDHVTGLPFFLPSFRMSFFDMDRALHQAQNSVSSSVSTPIDPYNCLERVQVTNFTGYSLAGGLASTISVKEYSDGEAYFESSAIGGPRNNPVYYLDLTDEQKMNSFTLEFPPLSEFYVTFAVGAVCEYGRTIQFTKPIVTGQCSSSL